MYNSPSRKPTPDFKGKRGSKVRLHSKFWKPKLPTPPSPPKVPAAGFRICRTCDQELPETNDHFYSANSTDANPLGLYASCKPCHDIRVFQTRIKRKYKITYDCYKELLEDQNYSCAICQIPPHKDRALCIDYNKATKTVIGLTCDNCHKGIVLMAKSIESATRALAYIEKAIEVKPIPKAHSV